MNLRPLRPEQSGNAPRWNYRQNSRHFIGWVNKLGIERTLVGRVAHFLELKFRLQRLALLFLFSLSLSFFISWDLDVNYSGYKEGDVAFSSVKSPMSFEVVDSERTESKKAEAQESVPAVYDYDVILYEQLMARVHAAFKNMRDLTGSLDLGSLQADFESDLGGISISKENFQWLYRKNFRGSIEAMLVQNLQRWSNQKILDDASPYKATKNQKRILVKILDQDVQGEEFLVDPFGVPDTTAIRKRLVSHDPDGQFTDLLRSLIIPNLTLNKLETELRRQRAREAVSPVVVPIRKGQIIVQEGEPVKRIHVTVFEELKHLKETRHQDFVSLMTAVFFVMLLLCFSGYLSRFTSIITLTVKDAAAMGVIVFLILAMAKFVLFISNTALIDHFSHVPISFYSYLIPASAGAMIVALIIPFGEVAWLFSMFLSVAIGLLLDRSFTFMIITFTSSIVAARGVHGCKKREDLYLAGIKTGLVNAGLIFCVTLMAHPSAEIFHREIFWNVSAGFFSGLLASLTTLMVIPFFETFFVYTTDIKLLELSNLNHPLLKDMIVKAPGTYHHSLVVGSMCEAAAEAIGANPLLAKVCAYYHDIGKTGHAQYFIENQRPGENRHDHISPGMSKTILIAHVKDGVEMGLKYKLGKPIIDVIEQHHGTTLISFFYHRAKEHEDSEMHEVTENEYRYPGPKPTFREAALCMLADSIEAAARSLDEPTPARLQSIVHNVVQKKFLDGQLDDCNITLKDVSVIEASFGKILLGIYHQRIDYPTVPKALTGRSSKEQTVS